MRTTLLATTLVFLASCAATSHDEAYLQAIDDFIAVGEIEAVDDIRYRIDYDFSVLHERYVIVTAGKNDYLVKFVRRCVELRDNTRITPDVRRESGILRAKFDTIRGCRIESIYPVNKGQIEELKSLVDAPGSTL